MIIFRNDDVTANTDISAVEEMYRFLKQKYPDCEIWSCINVFSRSAVEGSVYPDLPLSNKDLKYFYKVDSFFDKPICELDKVVSHGILHVDHSKLSKDAQEFSILTSCHYLDTNIFVPPFSRANEDTVTICRNNGITLTSPSDGWKSLETSPFTPHHNLWFFHSWRFTIESFKEQFEKATV